MAIRRIEEMPHEKMRIDLSGKLFADSVYILLPLAKGLSVNLGKNWPDIRDCMLSGGTEVLIRVFDFEFGDYVDIYW